MSFNITPVASGYHEIHPYSAMNIDSVKINTSLIMMKEWLFSTSAVLVYFVWLFSTVCVVFCYSAHQRTAVLTPAKLKLQSVTNFILKMRQWHTFRNIMILIITVVMIIDHHYRHPCHQCIVVSYHNHSASLSTSSSSSPLAMLCDELAAGWFTLRVIYFDTLILEQLYQSVRLLTSVGLCRTISSFHQ